MPTFADFLTPAGAIVAAGVVTSTIEILKAAIPVVGDRVSGALQAFVLTGVLYVATGFATGAAGPDAGLNVFLSWLTCATAAIGLKSIATHVSTLQAANAAGPVVDPAAGGDPPSADPNSLDPNKPA